MCLLGRLGPSEAIKVESANIFQNRSVIAASGLVRPLESLLELFLGRLEVIWGRLEAVLEYLEAILEVFLEQS